VTHVDGNAIAGLLADRLGLDSGAECRCAHCGRTQRLGQALVWFGPGVVVRCTGCAGILLVLTHRRGTTCADLTGLA
jgi:hypothetical protein